MLCLSLGGVTSLIGVGARMGECEWDDFITFLNMAYTELLRFGLTFLGLNLTLISTVVDCKSGFTS